MVEARLNELKNSYFKKAVINKNQLTKQIIEGYKIYKGGRDLTHKTPLCDSNAIAELEAVAEESNKRIEDYQV